MKTKKVLGKILVCLLAFIIGTQNTLVYALHASVLEDKKQVTNIGGETKNETDGVSISKTIEETNLENYFDITLKVNTTSNIEEIISSPDLAIVIVMDISYTMVENKVANGDTRYEAAMKAGESFIKKFAAEAEKNSNAKRMLGYVSFNTSAHQTFKIQRVTTKAQGNTLVSTMKEKTGAIVNKSGYNLDKQKFTNIEGGLQRAYDMLNSSAVKNIKNKYIILLSDGMPTTYLNNKTEDKKYDGYEPYSQTATKSDEGVFANGVLKKPCKGGADYSDNAAIKARKKATEIKNSNINIMVVGTGIKTINTIKYYLDLYKDKDFSTIDANKTTYEIGSANSRTSYENWLKTKIATNNQYYDSDSSTLTAAYTQIFNDITSQLKTYSQASWVAEDPMGTEGSTSNIQFVGIFDDLNSLHDSINIKNANQSDTASFSGNKINWDLKKSNYTTTPSGTKTMYHYELKYRIRLENEKNNFDINNIYETNGVTKLSYIVRNESTEILTQIKYLEFKIPAVVGYLGNLSFTKQSSFDNALLKDAKFTLTHDPNCECHQERKYATIDPFEVNSTSEGVVSFTNIPSGHKYLLTETTAPTDHIKTDQIYNIVVSYGEVTGAPANNTVFNDIKRGNLEIQKEVLGKTEKSGTFKFKLEVYFKGNKLSGLYNTKFNDTTDGTIDLNEGTINLKKGDKLTILDLPIGATYQVEELTTDGFKVEYTLNNGTKTLGKIATCNESNSCKLTEGATNYILFTNTTNYLLPETGSSRGLILNILSALFIGTPIISLLKQKRKNN